jgi:polyhydroxyalkanoate synthase
VSHGVSDRDTAARIARQMLAFGEKLASGAATLRSLPRQPERGATPTEAVHAIDGARLLRFRGSSSPTPGLPPLLIVYALVNRPYMLDLEPERSFVHGLLERGRDVYLVDWGYPGRRDEDTGLDHYVCRQVHGFVEHLGGGHGAPVDLLGVCQGGTLSLAYTALEPARVRRLALLVTPVDFHAEGFLLSRWLRHVDVDALVAATGNVPGSLLNWAFLSLKPLSLSGVKALGLVDLLDRPEELATFARMEQWLQDSPDQAGRAFREFVQAFFRDNALVNGGLAIGGRAVDLARVRQPVLNVYATRDHIVPPAASRPLSALLPAGCAAHEVDTGHIGIFASRRTSAAVPALVCDWYARA